MTARLAGLVLVALCCRAHPALAQCIDADGDGFSVGNGCDPVDCNDRNPDTYPGAVETCDSFDRDCDGMIDNSPSCIQACVAPEKIGPDVLVGTDSLESSFLPFMAWNGSRHLVAWDRVRIGKEAIATQLLEADGAFAAPRYDFPQAAFARGNSAKWTGAEYTLTWWGRDNGVYSIHFARIDADGNPIGSSVIVDSGPFSKLWPDHAWTGTEHGVVWFGDDQGTNEVFFRRVSAEGVPLGQVVQLTQGTESWDPKLAWTGSEYGVFWVRDPQGPSPSLRYRRLDADGNTVGMEIEVAPVEGRGFAGPVWTGDEFALAYSLSSGDDYEIYLRRVAPDGTLLSGDIQVTFDETDSWPADLCWNGSEYGMVWHDDDNTGDYELWFRSLDALGNAGPALPLTVDDPETSELPDLVWTGTEYALVWEDLRNFFFQVFFTRVGCDCSEDADGDLVSVCNDCDEGESATYPGAPQVCDGANNDCNHPSYPDLIGTNESDSDGDGTSECAGDCDDADMTVYSGAPEVNDGIDNQCPGNPGHGSVDETSGDSGFHTAGDTSAYDWPAQAGATQYEVARSENREFAGCTAVVVEEPAWMDPDLPTAGAAYYYLNRPLSPNPGSWGQDSAGGERAPDCL